MLTRLWRDTCKHACNPALSAGCENSTQSFLLTGQNTLTLLRPRQDRGVTVVKKLLARRPWRATGWRALTIKRTGEQSIMGACRGVIRLVIAIKWNKEAEIPGSRQTQRQQADDITSEPKFTPTPSLLRRKEHYFWCKHNSGEKDETNHDTGEEECRVMEKWNSPVVQACRLNLKHPEQMGEG